MRNQHFSSPMKIWEQAYRQSSLDERPGFGVCYQQHSGIITPRAIYDGRLGHFLGDRTQDPDILNFVEKARELDATTGSITLYQNRAWVELTEEAYRDWLEVRDSIREPIGELALAKATNYLAIEYTNPSFRIH